MKKPEEFGVFNGAVNPFPKPILLSVDIAGLAYPELVAHHPDPNNRNYPLCWQGINKVETKEVTSFAVSWIPEFMNCQDCKEWMHA